MRLSHLCSVTLVLGVAAATTFFACGGDGGNKNSAAVDAKVYLDAPSHMIDAPSATVTGLGQHCTPGAGSGITQGDCPTGYACLNLSGGNGSWCSKTCTAGSGDMCNVGYTGPGLGQCLWVINGTDHYCGIVCSLPSNPTACPNCNGTCPAPEQCTQTLTSGSANVGSACH